MPPVWLMVISWVALGTAFVCAGWILFDLYGRGYRQHMWIMEAVWPITCLYFGPVGLWAYYRWGRPQSHKWMEEHGDPPKKSFWATTAVGDSHCGAGLTLGDIIGSPAVVFLFGWKPFGLFLYAKYGVNYILAYIFGRGFQYCSIEAVVEQSATATPRAAMDKVADTIVQSAHSPVLVVRGDSVLRGGGFG